jgi:hypothetical protein
MFKAAPSGSIFLGCAPAALSMPYGALEQSSMLLRAASTPNAIDERTQRPA